MKPVDLLRKRPLGNELEVGIDRQRDVEPGLPGRNDALLAEGNRPPELVGLERNASRPAAEEAVVGVFDAVESVFVGADEAQHGRREPSAGVDAQPGVLFL